MLYGLLSHPEIHNISQHTGSTAGGTRLTLMGQHFDETDSPVSVMVAGIIPTFKVCLGYLDLNRLIFLH